MSKNTPPTAADIPRAPDTFKTILTDFVADLDRTFPEYSAAWSKWRAAEITEEELNHVFQYCMVFYPARFFDILYKNEDIFKNEESNTTDVRFLPNVEFRALYFGEGVSDHNRSTLWKYLQSILFSVIQSIDNSELFGADSLKMFENIDAADLKTKLEETMQNMAGLFSGGGGEAPSAAAAGATMDDSDSDIEDDAPQNPFSKFDAGKIHEHINTLLNGKIGGLAKELAEDVSREFSEDMFSEKDMTGNTAFDTQTMLKKIMENPAKMMDIVKKVSGKLDERMKSGDISQEEIMKEASDIMGRMKDIPGLGSIEKMVKQFGRNFGGGGAGAAAGGAGEARVDTNAMERMSKNQQMKEKLRARLEAKKRAQIEAAVRAAQIASTPTADYIDPSLLAPEPAADKKKNGGGGGKKKRKG